VGQLHASAPSAQIPYIQNDLYARYTTEAYLFDATVEPMPSRSQDEIGR
jgi:hypothetical protein